MQRRSTWMLVAGLAAFAPALAVPFLITKTQRPLGWIVPATVLPALIGIFLIAAYWRRRAGPDPTPAHRTAGNLVRLIALPGVYLALMMGLATGRGGSWLISLVDAVPMAVMFAGFGLFGFSARRTGDGRYCAKCGYEQSAHAHAAPQDHPVCPECGEDWHRSGGVVVGVRKLRRGLIALGVLMVVTPFVVTLGPLAGLTTSKALLRFMPNESLIAQIGDAPRGFVMDEWAVLKTRTLTAPQETRLAERLLDRRIRKGYVDRDSEIWLTTQQAAGGLPPTLRERLHSEAAVVTLDAPATARPGETVSVGLATRTRGGLQGGPGSPMPHIVFAGFTTRPDGADPHRATSGVPASGFGRKSININNTRPHPSPGPEILVQMPTSGEVRIGAEYYLVFAAPGALRSIRWNSDGTPDLPAAAVWSERRTIEHRITVAP